MAVAITQTADPASSTVSVVGSVGTYSTQSIGTASSDRIVMLCVGTKVASGTINSATIDFGSGAVAMKPLAQGTFGSDSSRMFWLNVTSGTTATFAVTFGATPTTTNQHISVYAVTGAYLTVSGGAQVSTDMDSTSPLRGWWNSSTGSASAYAIDIPTNGGMLAAASCATDTVGKTWAGLTEDLDEDAGDFRWTTAKSTTGGLTTVTCTGGTNLEDGALAFALFFPDTGAFGDVKAVGGNAAITGPVNPFQPQSVITLAVGDLVIVNIEEQTTASTTGVTDDLGNTGTQLNNTGSSFLKTYYYIVTSAGDATISAACTPAAHNVSMSVAVFNGPFATSPLDQNPNMLSDTAEPYTSNLSGTLSQAGELIVGYFSTTVAQLSWDTPSPGATAVQAALSGGFGNCITSTVVSATTSLTMAISGNNAAANPTVCGIATFKKGAVVGVTFFAATEDDYSRPAIKRMVGY